MRIASRLVALAAALAAIGGALYFMLWPLPVVSGTGYCGPGATSDSAIEVKLNPGVVLQGAPPDQNADASASAFLQGACVGEANDRLREAGVTFGIAALVAVGAGFAPRLTAFRPAGRPA